FLRAKMDRSRTWQLMAMDARAANSTARSLSTGSAPGRPRQTGQTLVFGAEPKRFTQPQKALVSVRSWTWTSSPMTGSYLAKISGERLNAVLILFSLEQNSKFHGLVRKWNAPPYSPDFQCRGMVSRVGFYAAGFFLPFECE